MLYKTVAVFHRAESANSLGLYILSRPIVEVVTLTPSSEPSFDCTLSMRLDDDEEEDS